MKRFTFPENEPIRRSELWILTGILMLGAFFRFHLLATSPYGAWFDEAQNTIESLRILSEPGYWPVFIAGRSQLPAFAFYCFAPFVALMGDSGVLGVRLAATCVGIGAIMAVWLFAREVFGRQVALYAAFFLSILRWHVTFSRFGMVQVFTTLFIPLVLLYLVRIMKGGTSSDAVKGGVLLGLGLQTYYSMFTLPIVCFVGWAWGVLVGAVRVGSIKRLLFAGCIALLVYGPVLNYAITNSAQFSERLKMASGVSPVAVAKNLLHPTEAGNEELREFGDTTFKHLSMFHIHGDANGRHNIPGEPMLDPITGLAFGMGFLFCLMRLFDPRYFILLLSWSASIAGGIFSLSFEAPQGGRTVGITPMVAVISAIPVAALGTFISRRIPKLFSVLLLTLAISAGYNWYQFFNVQLFHPEAWASYSTQETKIAHVMRELGTNASYYLPETKYGGPTEELIAKDLSLARPFNRYQDLPLVDDGREAVVFVEPPEKETIETLMRLYPHARIEPFGPPRSGGTSPSPILYIFRITREEIDALKGWRMEEAGEYAGTLRVINPGTYTFRFERGESGSLFIDGTEIEGGASYRLARGNHLVHLSHDSSKREAVPILQWKGGNEDQFREVPRDAIFSPSVYEGGLLGRYAQMVREDESPSFEQIDSIISFYFHLLPLPRPYAIEWSGELYAERGGEYEIGTTSLDGSSVWLDGREIVKNPGVHEYTSATISLNPGWHQIAINYEAINNYNQMYLFWRPPGQAEKSIVPANVLRPPKLSRSP